jgi:hypothetical protein
MQQDAANCAWIANRRIVQLFPGNNPHRLITVKSIDWREKKSNRLGENLVYDSM